MHARGVPERDENFLTNDVPAATAVGQAIVVVQRCLTGEQEVLEFNQDEQ